MFTFENRKFHFNELVYPSLCTGPFNREIVVAIAHVNRHPGIPMFPMHTSNLNIRQNHGSLCPTLPVRAIQHIQLPR